MRAVKRWRYYCDFCKKAGMSSFHMKNHENSCTLNPARACRMCVKLNGGSAATMEEMLAVLPDPASFMIPGADYIGAAPMVLDDAAIRSEIVHALPKLRELVNGCPVCIMAAFRQRKIPLPLVDDFNFSNEMSSIWADLAAERGDFYG